MRIENSPSLFLPLILPALNFYKQTGIWSEGLAKRQSGQKTKRAGGQAGVNVLPGYWVVLDLVDLPGLRLAGQAALWYYR